MSMLLMACAKEEKTVAYDKNTTTLIHIHGKTDKRLQLYFNVMYRGRYFRDGVVSNECKDVLSKYHGQKKPTIKSAGVIVKNTDEYNITIPIYNKSLRMRCTYDPIGISLQIRRAHEKHGLYADIPILTDTPSYISSADRGSMGGGWNARGMYRGEQREKIGHVEEPPKYFRIINGATVKCYTARFKKDRITKEHVRLHCDLPYKNIDLWQEEIKDDNIEFNVVVDENKNYFYPTLEEHRRGVKKLPEVFQEEHLSWYDTLKLWMKGEKE